MYSYYSSSCREIFFCFSLLLLLSSDADFILGAVCLDLGPAIILSGSPFCLGTVKIFYVSVSVLDLD